MTKLVNKNRRDSTRMRDERVHALYERLMDELGELGCCVSKGYIYGRIGREVGLSARMVSFILNHTRPVGGGKL